MAEQLTKENFDENVLKSDVPVLVDFWAPWCGPCKILGPIIDKLGDQLDGKAKVFKVNVDDNPELAAQYQVRGIPTVIAFKKGEISEELVGVRPEAAYIKAVE